jgi:hypothetical protein
MARQYTRRTDAHRGQAEVVETPAREDAEPRVAHREPTDRERAEARAKQLLENIDEIDNIDGADTFWVDPNIVPDGWTYEWKTWTVWGKEEAERIQNYERAGWERVPTKRHPQMMPLGSRDPFIHRQGQMLMERPKIIADRFTKRMYDEARGQVAAKEAEAKGFSPNAAGFESTKNTINRGWEAIPIPKD